MLDSSIIGARIDPRNNNLTKNNMKGLFGPDHREEAPADVTPMPRIGSAMPSARSSLVVSADGSVLRLKAAAGATADDLVNTCAAIGAQVQGASKGSPDGSMELGLRFTDTAQTATSANPTADVLGNGAAKVAEVIERVTGKGKGTVKRSVAIEGLMRQPIDKVPGGDAMNPDLLIGSPNEEFPDPHTADPEEAFFDANPDEALDDPKLKI